MTPNFTGADVACNVSDNRKYVLYHICKDGMAIDDGYIGVTCDTSKRFSRHKLDLKKGVHANVHLQRVYNKGYNLIYKVLVVGGKDYVYNLEKTLRPIKQIGYNIAEGGFHPPSNKGVPMDDEQKKKISLSNIGKTNSKEHIAKIVSTRRTNGSYKLGKDNPCSKPVKQYSLERNLLATFVSATEAGKILGYGQGVISNACRKSEKAYNYYWEYDNDNVY